MTNERMKTTLFYVFLGIFVVTAAFTLAALFKLPGFNIDKEYLKYLSIALIGQVIGIVLCLAKALFFGSTDFIKFVKKDEPGIWQGFVGAYRAYNAPWLLEFTSGGALTDEYMPIHKERMSNPALRSVDYVYFADDAFSADPQSESWVRFERFVRFEAMVFYGLSRDQTGGSDFAGLLAEKLDQDEPANLSKLGAYLCEGEVPSMTFFFGYKGAGGKKKEEDKPEKTKKTEKARECIWYVASEPFYNKGNPQKIFHIRNADFWEDLHEVFRTAIRSEKRLQGPAIFRKYIEIVSSRE